MQCTWHSARLWGYKENQESSQSLPHVNKQHLHFSSFSGQNSYCHLWLPLSYFKSHSDGSTIKIRSDSNYFSLLHHYQPMPAAILSSLDYCNCFLSGFAYILAPLCYSLKTQTDAFKLRVMSCFLELHSDSFFSLKVKATVLTVVRRGLSITGVCLLLWHYFLLFPFLHSALTMLAFLLPLKCARQDIVSKSWHLLCCLPRTLSPRYLHDFLPFSCLSLYYCCCCCCRCYSWGLDPGSCTR